MKFTSTNHYIKYKLYEHLNSINPSIFTSGYTFLVPYTVTGLTSENFLYYDQYNDPENIIYTPPGYDLHGTLIKISGITIDVNYFRKNTYLNIISSGLKYKTLIIDVVSNEYLIIETYKYDPTLVIDGLETIYELKDVSEILYDIYIDDDTIRVWDPTYHNYYRKRKDNQRRDISNAYAKFISEDRNIIDQTTAILMLDEEKKFILKLYDPENTLNGGIVRLAKTYIPEYMDSGLTSKSAKIYGEISDDGGSTIIEKGICYSKINNIPNLNADYKSIGYGSVQFYSILVDLEPSTKYYYSAYAINGNGISYGEVKTFTTLEKSISIPTVYTIEESNTNIIKDSTSISGITSVVADTGWVLDLDNPYVSEDLFQDENSIIRILPSGGSYMLEQGLEYWVAVFPGGSPYYNYVWRVGDGDPLLPPDGYTQLDSVNSVTGEVTYNLVNGKISERGFCYLSGTSTPDLTNTIDPLNNSGRILLIDDGKTGTDSYFITGIPSPDTYTFRSYAINENGVGYGNSIQIVVV